MKPSTLLPLLSLLSASASAHPPPSRRSPPSQYKLSHAPIPSIPGPTFHRPGSKSALASSSSSPESQKAGARLSGTNITSVSTTFRIPLAEMATTGPTADNENGVYQASYWVGIDGVTSASCGGVSLRAGVDTFWDTGMRSTGAWYEWYPSQESSQFGNFTLVQGDVVRITAVADGDGLGGEVRVERVDGLGCEAKVLASASHRFEGVASGDRLCLGEAAWVIEDYPLLNQPEFPLALANFTEVVFQGVEVNGQGAKGMEVFDINLEAQGGRLTDCEVGDGGSVDCKRVVGDA
ncbi:concanavalin A-like lectin/glucanase [Coniochaeta ligniaria NRRL 30616]|uniref:Concanavalin A-like lectin/glucanase n=1 Tax=Coniochaeta ligniaria NRRL 30616 TaxID=1408157 RepID=A0A1J7JIR4_9PEZI|nr:concanavalin A-like lectin/glucanase [Coniochaeta ligniaria NRRL 30616]